MNIVAFCSAVGLLCLLAAVYMYRKGKRVTVKNDTDSIRGFDELTEAVRCAVNEILNTDLDGSGLAPTEIRKKKRQQAKLRLSTRQACFGDTGSSEYLKEYIKELLINRLGINEATICRIIPFNESGSMSATELFEYMYMIYRRHCGIHVFGRMVKDHAFNEAKSDDEGRPVYSIDEDDIRRAFSECGLEPDYTDMLDTLTQRCYEKLYGHDVADLLIMDPDIDGVSGGVGGCTRIEYSYLEELMSSGRDVGKKINSYDVIYCVYRGRLIRMKFLSFGREETLERVVKNIYRYNSKTTLSKRNPVLHASMKNNSRIVVARPPVSDSWAFYVRKFASTDARKIESLITDKNSDRVIALLKSIVKAECNFVISGNTGGGKTTLLKSLIGYINPSYTLRVIESSFELNINNLYPDRNVHVMQERGDFTIYDAITASKKMDTDVLILGEVNEPKVAGAFIQVAQSGSRMAITTLHHETTQKLIEYLRNALVCEFGLTDVHVAQKQVVDSVSFDVHMVHDVTGHHYIERITQIIPSQKDERYELKDIVVFDTEKKMYRFVGEVSSVLPASVREAAG
ncbi:MAG: Flp pilus assembly complex ATPase component TadA [Lachnospiraceae bacterium]|nr:Flp pilus assembly complex ATPase component TadA [Lachnospiraceae bacterium]